ncbi:MAG TPA: DUF3889 domain-containing protein [Bacillota bacterium]|nr:DUF3889 domain-containing protein [Bacillota bacterium]
MKWLMKITLVLFMVFSSFIFIEHAYSQQHITEPTYAKWGRFAVDAVNKKYGVKVVDYLHIGRKVLTPTVTQETFKLWVRRNSHEFGVYVTIKFETSTDKVLSVNFKETTR